MAVSQAIILLKTGLPRHFKSKKNSGIPLNIIQFSPAESSYAHLF